MGNILVKKIYLSRSGESNHGQDAMECNFVNGRFAVADGVTNSFHPEFVAQALCNTFVKENVPVQEWIQQLSSHILNEISDLWANEVESLASRLNGRQRRLFEMNREDFPMGSSTFAGIECNLSSSSLSYHILGDSSLFIIPQEGDFSIVCSSHREERHGRQYVIYDDTPSCISNFVFNCQGRPRLYFNDHWEEGYCPIAPGFVVLLTDGAAQWLQDALIENKKSIEVLWNISTQNELLDFVSEQRAQNKMDDDLAIYILKIDSETNCGFEEVILRSESLVGGETKVIREEEVSLHTGKTTEGTCPSAQDISEIEVSPSTKVKTTEETSPPAEDFSEMEVSSSTEVKATEETSPPAEDFSEMEVSPSTEVEITEENSPSVEHFSEEETPTSTEIGIAKDYIPVAEEISGEDVHSAVQIEIGSEQFTKEIEIPSNQTISFEQSREIESKNPNSLDETSATQVDFPQILIKKMKTTEKIIKCFLKSINNENH